MSNSSHSLFWLLLVMLLNISTAHGQPWHLTRDRMSDLLREESEVHAVIDGVEAKKLGLEVVRCQEHRLNGQQFDVGFRKAAVQLVQFRPSYDRRRPNWYQTLASLFGDDLRRDSWRFDEKLSSLFPPVTQFSLEQFPETKAGQTRAFAFDPRTGRVSNATSWHHDVVETGRFRWAHSASSIYRFVLRRRDGQAFAIVEGSDYESQELHPDAINVVRPFVHRPQDIKRVMVASPDVFFEYLIRACGHQLDNSAGSSTYEQQVSKFIPKSNRDDARNLRLSSALQFALQEPKASVKRVAAAIDESDIPYLLETATSRSRDNRFTRRRKLELLEIIGRRNELVYCAQFIERPAFKAQSLSAIAAIAKREKITLPPTFRDASAASWKALAKR